MTLKVFAKLDAHRLSSTTRMVVPDGHLALTFDFAGEAVNALLDAIPADLSSETLGLTRAPFIVDFSHPLNFNIAAQLGEVVSVEDDDFVPFEVLTVELADPHRPVESAG